MVLILKKSKMNKSLSETDINQPEPLHTPPNFVSQRMKRGRDDMEDSLVKQLGEFKDEIRRMLGIFTERHEKDTQRITTTLNEIQKTNNQIESSIAYLTAQNEEYRIKIAQLEAQAREDKNCITVLEDKLEMMQISNQKTNFVIKNVPRRAGETKEDLLEMAMCLAKNLDCSFTKRDIKDVYRTRARNSETNNTPIIVETVSTLIKTEIMKMGKAHIIKFKSKLCCKHLGFKSQEDTPIFLSEHLTSRGSRLHFLARDLTKSGEFKFCWTAYGKVLLKKDEHSPTITVRNEQQIQQLKNSK